jgi:hypothetical protein
MDSLVQRIFNSGAMVLHDLASLHTGACIEFQSCDRLPLKIYSTETTLASRYASALETTQHFGLVAVSPTAKSMEFFEVRKPTSLLPGRFSDSPTLAPKCQTSLSDSGVFSAAVGCS